MVGKNNAAVIAGIGKISTPKVTSGRSVDFAGAVDSFLRGYDWGNNLRKQKEEEANREALALALQAEDEAQIADAWAKFDPMGYAERLDKIKEARIKREQALADAEVKHNRAVALEELRNRLGIKKDEAAHERELALEKLKRDWSLEDKGLERQYALEDAEAERQDFYAQEAYKKELEAQYDKEDIEKLPDALVYANELDKLDPNNPAHQPRIKILDGLLAKEMAISGGKTSVPKEIQLINMRASLDPNDPVQAEQINLIDKILVSDKQGTKAKEIQLLDRRANLDPNDPAQAEERALIDASLVGKQQQQKDTRTNEEKRYDFAKAQGFSDEESIDFAMKTGKFTPNQPKPAKTPEQISNEEMAKADAKAKVERQKNIAEYDGKIAVLEDALKQIFGDNGLASRANIGYEKPNVVGIWNRATPTIFTDEEIQEARGAMANIVGMVRLGLTEFLKGSVSNYEQQLLQDVSSGNITKYTPKQIKGALEAMSKRFKTLRDNLAGDSSEKEVTQNSLKKQPVKIKSITREK